MYQSFFGLQEAPFSLTPDTRYFYPCPSSQAALNVLLVALASGEGFVKVVGDVGTGKTMLCRQILDLLGDSFMLAYLPNPLLSPPELYRAIGMEWGLPWPTTTGLQEYLLSLTQHLEQAARQGKKAALLVDEAQSLPTETLEALRLLTNLETQRHKVIQVALFAQPELERRLLTTQGRALHQRITFSYTLAGLQREDVPPYLHHRLRTAGWQGESLFSHAALAEMAQASRGIPRLINIITHKALMSAYGEGSKEIHRRHVMLAVADTEAAGPSLPWWQLAWLGLRGGWRQAMAPSPLPLHQP
ncbi:MAG: AAA family ATPase [Magnetococcales bacterium]|nr:AAA family ATPase [Magnetococcales bacterium]NGZ27658.1 AAA family ATPase [Magnetococcales bacterium]